MLRIGCYAKQTKSIQLFNPPPIVYNGALVKFNAVSNISRYIYTSLLQCFGFQGYFKPIGMYTLKTTKDFQSHFTLHVRLPNKFEPYIFHNFIDFEFSIYRIFIVTYFKRLLPPSQQLLVVLLHYILDYPINLSLICFIISLMLDLAYIEYLLCQILSCHHPNNCLFLFILPAEVLLNFFGECTWPGQLSIYRSHKSYNASDNYPTVHIL